MKKYSVFKSAMAVCLTAGMLLSPAAALELRAAEVVATVEGTVLEETTSEILHLSTPQGKMEIKLDEDTDTSACKVLLPDTKISVSVSHGSDGYMHAVKLGAKAANTGVTVDSSNASTVTGKLDKKSKGDILFVKTPQGDMEIKLDPSTNMNGCNVLVADKNYTIVCARGSDAYMHALSITDGVSQGAVSGLTPAPSDPSSRTAAVGSVSGTVHKDTKENLLYLSTKEGVMQFVIEGNTDSTRGMVLVPDRKLTVSFYHGSDGYLHAVDITAAKKDSDGSGVDTSSVSTVTGTVEEESDEDILFLKTKHGVMELKLDAVSSVSGCKVFISGKELSVSCARGSDAYMHALNITAI